MIGNSLLKLSAETQKWQAGYQILCHMVSYNIDYLKYCGQYRHIASVAMEICLQCCQPDSALQILKGNNKVIELCPFSGDARKYCDSYEWTEMLIQSN